MENVSLVSPTFSWVRGKCVGKGSFGTVSLGVSQPDGRVFAVKSVDRKMGLSNQLEALENEIRILRLVSSPYVVGFLGDDITCETSMTSYRNLHMEYLPGGTVNDLPYRYGGKGDDVDERFVRYCTWCVVNALKCVHSRGIVHCDVKGENILVGSNSSIAKLADFGSAIKISGDTRRDVIVPRGSPLWMAPEVIRQESQGPESDVWSLGCTVIEMITGNPAWEDHGINTLSLIGYSDTLPEFPTQLSEIGCDFLEKCLRSDPSRRWNCDQLLQHPFLSSASPNIKVSDSSPRCVLDWINSGFEEEEEEDEIGFDFENSAKERIGKLASSLEVKWESEGWVEIRSLASETEPETGEGEGTILEYQGFLWTEEEIELGTTPEYSDSLTPKTERANSEIRSSGGTSPSGASVCDQSKCEVRREAGSSCPHGSQKRVKLMAWKRGIRINSFCNLLVLSNYYYTLPNPLNKLRFFFKLCKYDS
ncbi:Mitogen-activated protein kinase kinase kinase, partial [Quillaja saponaria]